MIRSCSLLLAAFAAFAEPADSIWTGRYVVTMDASRRVIENGAVAVKGSRILAAGPAAEIRAKYQGKVVPCAECVLLPGLINTHQHAPMSLLRGISGDRTLQDWLENFIFPAEAKNVDREFVRWGTRLAVLEMLLAGTTTYADMYYFEDTIAEETKAAGMRGVLGQTIIGFPAPDYKTVEAALAGAEAFLKRFAGDELIVPAPAPHAIYTNRDETIRASRRLATKYKVPLLIHLAETKKERDDAQFQRGMSPVRVLEAIGALEGRTLGAHGIWLDDADLEILAKRGTGLAHCPSSNAMLASGVARVPEILAKGIAMGLGTDAYAGTNNDASLFEEMDLAAKLQKVSRMDPRAVTARQMLEMATITGARALGMEKEIGSLEAGKSADFIAVRLDAAHAAPLYDVESHAVYALKASDVKDVVIRGRQVVRDRQALTLDAAAIRAKAVWYRDRIRASLAAR
jgi:5-methylthioadenosine/S-adenosylhomocysteine deaminase